MSLVTNTRPKTEFHVEECGDAPDWDDYVQEHPKGTVFHTAAMVRAFARTRRHRPVAIAARDPEGRIAALLVAVRVDTLGGAASHFASRSIFYAEPICRDDAQGAAALSELIRVHDRRMSGVLFAEVRPIGPPGAERAVLEQHGYQWKDYLNYVVDLTPSEDELVAGMRKSLRRRVRRNSSLGVAVKEECYPLDHAHLYAHFAESYARSSVPLAHESLFEAAAEELTNDVYRVSTVQYNGDSIAAGVCLAFKGRMYAWYAGSHRVPGVYAHDSLTWEEILWAKRQGLECYDFGGAGWPDEEYGPREFKAKFGGELVCYGRYRKVFAPIRMKVAQVAYGAARRIVSPAAVSDASRK